MDVIFLFECNQHKCDECNEDCKHTKDYNYALPKSERRFRLDYADNEQHVYVEESEDEYDG